jgi:hypothetical protein
MLAMPHAPTPSFSLRENATPPVAGNWNLLDTLRYIKLVQFKVHEKEWGKNYDSN